MGTPQSSIICKITLPQDIKIQWCIDTAWSKLIWEDLLHIQSETMWLFCASVSKFSRITIFTSRILCPDRSPRQVCLPASHHMCTLTSLQGHPRARHKGEVHRAAAARSIMHRRVVAPELVHDPKRYTSQQYFRSASQSASSHLTSCLHIGIALISIFLRSTGPLRSFILPKRQLGAADCCEDNRPKVAYIDWTKNLPLEGCFSHHSGGV